MFTLASTQETAVLITPSTRPEAIAEALRRLLSHRDLQEVVSRLATETPAQEAASSH
jgi:hypothetical protein